MKNSKPVREKIITPSTTINVLDMQRQDSYDIEKARQQEIDNYNFDECFAEDEFFDTIELEGEQIIIKLFKENYIKEINSIGDQVVFDCWISQVDGRMNQAQSAKWVDNPLPYVNMGVVVAMSPLAIAKEYEKAEKINSLAGGKVTYTPLTVGTVVHTRHMNYADVRFYKDKQQRDFIKNPQEYRIRHWEGLVLVHPTVVEAKTTRQAVEGTSPYRMYLKNEN